MALREAASGVAPNIKAYVSEIPSMRSAQVASDWERAVSFILAGMTAKLQHWADLPYVLCGLGHMQPDAVPLLHLQLIVS